MRSSPATDWCSASCPPGSKVGTCAPRRRAQLRALGLGLDDRAAARQHRHPPRQGRRPASSTRSSSPAPAWPGSAALDAITESLDPVQMLPAPSQGALAVECRADDPELIASPRRLDDAATRAAVVAERALLAELEAGCTAPVGAIAEVVESIDDDGRIFETVPSAAARPRSTAPTSSGRPSVGSPERADELGRAVARELLDLGARDLMTVAEAVTPMPDVDARPSPIAARFRTSMRHGTHWRTTDEPSPKNSPGGSSSWDPDPAIRRCSPSARRDVLASAALAFTDPDVDKGVTALVGTALGRDPEPPSRSPRSGPHSASPPRWPRPLVAAAKNGHDVVRLVAGDPLTTDSVVKEVLGVAPHPGAVRRRARRRRRAPRVPAYAGVALGLRPHRGRPARRGRPGRRWPPAAGGTLVLHAAPPRPRRDRGARCRARPGPAAPRPRHRRGTDAARRARRGHARAVPRRRRARAGRPAGRHRRHGRRKRARLSWWESPRRCSAGGCWCRAPRTRPAR